MIQRKNIKGRGTSAKYFCKCGRERIVDEKKCKHCQKSLKQLQKIDAQREKLLKSMNKDPTLFHPSVEAALKKAQKTRKRNSK